MDSEEPKKKVQPQSDPTIKGVALESILHKEVEETFCREVPPKKAKSEKD